MRWTPASDVRRLDDSEEGEFHRLDREPTHGTKISTDQISKMSPQSPSSRICQQAVKYSKEQKQKREREKVSRKRYRLPRHALHSAVVLEVFMDSNGLDAAPLRLSVDSKSMNVASLLRGSPILISAQSSLSRSSSNRPRLFWTVSSASLLPFRSPRPQPSPSFLWQNANLSNTR